VGAPSDTPTAAPTAAARDDGATAAARAQPGDAPPRDARARRRRVLFALAAVALIAAAFAIRLAYVGATPGMTLRDDGLDYDGHAVSIALTGRFSDTLAYGRPTAFRPPVFPYLLGEVYKATGVARADAARRVVVARRTQVVIGTVLVAAIGLLAAQLFGEVVALVALALAAVYVPLVTMSGSVMSEPLFAVFMLASLSAAIAHRRSPHRLRWALLAGLLAGLAILTRANALILLLPLGLAVWDRRPRWTAGALVAPVALVLVTVAVVTPWTLRNERVLHHFVPVSTQLGSALAGTYNDEARTDPDHPASWRSLRGVPSYADIFSKVAQTNEAVLEQRLRHRAERYALDHPTYPAVVAFWTTVRALELDGRSWWRHTASTVSIRPGWADRGVYCFWLFAVLAVAGAFTRAARRAPWFVWAFPALMSLSVVFLVIETPRYRTAIDPFIVLLAALALVSAGRRLARR
jgi:4-amino-4-deoxy-L-arabinose transferase-like glycosyltransferase